MSESDQKENIERNLHPIQNRDYDSIMPYPDPILVHLMSNFSLAQWTFLEILSGELDREKGQDAFPIQLTLSALNDRVQMSQQNFRAHVSLLHGANAVELVTGLSDQRSKQVRITENGLRMLKLRRG